MRKPKVQAGIMETVGLGARVKEKFKRSVISWSIEVIMSSVEYVHLL